MRIAMIIEAWKPIWGGGQAHVFELSKKLITKHDCQVDIYVMNLKNNTGNNQPEIEKFENGNLQIIRTGKIRNFHSFKDRIFWITEVIKEINKNNKKHNYTLVHAHANLPGVPGKILSKLLKIPIVYTIHGSGTDSTYNMYGKNVKSWLLNKIEKFLHTKIKYSALISVNRCLPYKKNRNKFIKIIPNGVDISKYKRNHKDKKNDIPFKMIFVGRLHPQKGLLFLLSAIRDLKAKLPKNFELHIIGKGSSKDLLISKANLWKISNFIHFRGEIFGESLVNEYLSSDLFILPSLFEGQPLTLLEAWAAKLPVIVTDVGDNKYFVQNEVNGYIIPSQNSKLLAKTIIAAINNPKLKEMGLAGYNLVNKKYSWSKVADKTYEVYQKIS